MTEDHYHEEIYDTIDDHVSYLAEQIIKLTARVVTLERVRESMKE